MSRNILITGAAGYIGGSLVAGLLAGNLLQIDKKRISAAVRSEEQAKALSKLGINVVQLDLTNEQAVMEAVLYNDISIIVHCAGTLNPAAVLPLINALGQQKETTNEQTYFIHTSASSAFYPVTGWPDEEMIDTGSIFEVEKQLQDSFPIRKTDVAVIEQAKAKGVISFTVIPPIVYGKGSGEWNKLSVVLPVYIKACIDNKSMYKFHENTKKSGVHISDITALYALIIGKILRNEEIPNGEKGYYFAFAHNMLWWDVVDGLATSLHARGVITYKKVHEWSSNAAAAETLGVPEFFVKPLWSSGDRIASVNAYNIGWKPTWTEQRFLDHIDNETEAVLELGKAKSSLIDSLFSAGK